MKLSTVTLSERVTNYFFSQLLRKKVYAIRYVFKIVHVVLTVMRSAQEEEHTSISEPKITQFFAKS